MCVFAYVYVGTVFMFAYVHLLLHIYAFISLSVGGYDCLLVKTDHNAGTLNVFVNEQRVISGNNVYGKGGVVLDRCFESLDKIEVQNPTDNAWVGSISVSNDGGASYRSVSACTACIYKGDSSSSSSRFIGVDGNNDIHAMVACVNRAKCELLLPRGLQILHTILLRMCVHTWVCTQHTCIRTRACMYVWLRMYGCVYVRMRVCMVAYVWLCVRTYVCMYVCACTYACMCVLSIMYVRTYVCMFE